MAIDKVTPQKLNSSVDARYRSNTDMSDALNINFGEDHKSNSGDSTSGGDLGVLKPTPSNTLLSGSNLNSNSRVIGSVTDDVLGIIFFFVWAANADEMGVWAYDRDGVLPGSSANNYVKVLTSSRFGFPALGFVDGDVVHIGQKYSSDNRDIQDPLYSESSDKSCVLYFTDNINEPRKLDVYRAMTADLSGYGVYDINDLIKACPRTPLEPITFEFSISPLRKTSNFEKIPGMQFAYQFMYKGGVESPISTYSRLAIPKGYIQQGINTSPTLNENVCILKLPPTSPTASVVKNITEEVEKVRVLVRFGNTGGWKIIEEIKVEKFVENNYTYLFYNDKILIPVSEEETAMHFSGLPRKARSQAIVSNRLIYANYLEGFDNVECTAIATPVYKEVSQNIADLTIVVRPYILQPLKTAEGSALVFDLDGREQKIAGYKFDTGGVPWVSLPIGSVIDISFSANPEKNYHIYDYANSFHGNDQVGGIDDEISNVEYTIQDSDMEDNLRTGRQIFGANNGVGFHLDPAVSNLESDSIIHNEWVSFNPYTGAETVSPVVHGTSAATPFVIKGGSVDFKLRFTTNYNVFNNSDDLVSDVRLAVRDAIYFFLTGEGQMPTQCAEVDGVDVCIPFATLVNDTNKNTSSYSFDLGVDSENYREDLDSAVPFRNTFPDSLVCGLSDKIFDEDNLLDYNQLLNSPPVGYFAVIKADVTIGLTSMKATMNERYAEGTEYGDPEDAYIALEVVSLENVATRTCIPVIEGYSGGTPAFQFNFQDELQNLIFSHWTVRTDDEIQQIAPSVFETTGLNSAYNPTFTNLAHIQHADIEQTAYPTQLGNATRAIIAYGGSGVNGESFTPVNPDPLMNTENERLKLVGYLRANTSLSGEQPKLLLTGDEYRDYRKSIYEEFTNTPLSDSSILERFKFSLLDGEGVNSFTGACIFLGWMLYKPGPNYKKVSAPNGHQTMLLSFNNNPNINPNLADDDDYLTVTSPSFPESLTDTSTVLHSWIEILLSSSYISMGGDLSSYGSYKSSCNHDFGIIYYDERGRSGLVNYLTSVYVGGFSDMEPTRGENKGRASIAIDIQHEPPSWAHSYQIAYGGNSSIEDFIQYSTGPAFVDILNSNENVDGVIYVSLTYLQGDNNVSYSHSWGSVNKDGGNSLYTYSVGDKLRVISYFNNDGSSSFYPNNYEFEVIGVKTMTSSTTENFFHGPNDGGEVHPSKIGEFIMLKNNVSALDFSYGDIYSSFIQDEGFNGTTIHNKWNNKTVVEIYSPKKNLDVESRIYYETGNKHNVSTNLATGQRYHQSNPLLLEDGDVYFRRVPLNLPIFSSNGYKPLLNSNFRNYFLETDTFTDLFAGANGKNYGKPKIMFSTATEARNRSSVTFSERNNYSSKFNSFTRFNLTILPFKDLPNEYGAIQSLVNEYDSILVIQENKISSIPVERNILATAGGSTSLIASGKILGTQKFYAGDYGCDTNPESVTRAGTSVYFASKKRKEVYMYSPNQGVAVVSDAGMKTFFYSLFSNAMANADSLGVVRVVGGYDPLKDEFLLSVINNVDPDLNSGSNGGGLGGGGLGMITIEGGDLGDVIPINLSSSGEYGGSIEDVVYDDGGDTSAIEISVLEAQLAVANSTVEDLIALVNQISSDLLEATSDLGELQIFFNDLLGDAANGALYSTGVQTSTLPNGATVNYSTYSQFVNAVSNEIVAAEALIDDLNDKIVDTNLEIGLLYNSFISNTNNFVSLTESYQTVLLELELTDESTQIDLFLGDIANNIPETETIQMTYSDGSVATITVTDLQDNSWMASINLLTSQINTLFQGIPGGDTGFGELVTTAIQDLDTTNANLISAFRSFIQSITSLKKQDQTLLFGDDEIGDSLATFLAGTGLDGLDVNNDGVFTNTELNALPTVEGATIKFQNALDSYISGLTVVNAELSVFIGQLLAAANESNFGYKDNNGNPIVLNADNAQTPGIGFANYITFLETKLSDSQGETSGALTSLEEANLTLSALRDEVLASFNASIADGSLLYNGVDNYADNTSLSEFNETLIGKLTESSALSHFDRNSLFAQISFVKQQFEALQQSLLISGYAPTTTEILEGYETGVQSLQLIPFVQNALVDLKDFQQMFAEGGDVQFGKQGAYKLTESGEEELVLSRDVTAPSIQNLGIEALQGLKNAIDSIQLALVSSGIEDVNAPTNYLSPAILSLFPEDGGPITPSDIETLTQYIQSNGITMDEVAQLQAASGSLESLDRTIWGTQFTDLTNSGAIGTNDLLQFLLSFGLAAIPTTTNYTYKTNANGELETDEDGNLILVDFNSTPE